jgi:hypothetical protein
MATTTFQGIVRSNGGAGKGNATPSVVTMSEVISFNAAGSNVAVRIGTSATAGNTFKLPVGAIPISFLVVGVSTGAGSTCDVGSSADSDGFFNEIATVTKGTLKGADGALAVAGGITAITEVSQLQQEQLQELEQLQVYLHTLLLTLAQRVTNK